jgi:hypothetical protein
MSMYFWTPGLTAGGLLAAMTSSNSAADDKQNYHAVRDMPSSSASTPKPAARQTSQIIQPAKGIAQKP